MNTFGSFLSSKRKENNLTQKELANKLYVTESAVSKWEKDKAHPDITLLPELAQILHVSEHELITASTDDDNRKKVADAKKWRTVVTTWNMFFYISYVITLVTCFIVNLATSGTLSWFWIVLCAIVLAAVFTSVPNFIKKNKVFFISSMGILFLFTLLLVISIYMKGNWFSITGVPIFGVYVAIFLPIYIKLYKFPKIIKRNTGLIVVILDSILLLGMLYLLNRYTSGTWFNNFALPISLYFITTILFITIIKSYFKMGSYLKISLVLLICTLSFIGINYILKSLLKESFNIIYANSFNADFLNWQGDYIGNNVITLIVCLLGSLSFIFLCLGISKHNKKPI